MLCGDVWQLGLAEPRNVSADASFYNSFSVLLFCGGVVRFTAVSAVCCCVWVSCTSLMQSYTRCTRTSSVPALLNCMYMYTKFFSYKLTICICTRFRVSVIRLVTCKWMILSLLNNQLQLSFVRRRAPRSRTIRIDKSDVIMQPLFSSSSEVWMITCQKIASRNWSNA